MRWMRVKFRDTQNHRLDLSKVTKMVSHMDEKCAVTLLAVAVINVVNCVVHVNTWN